MNATRIIHVVFCVHLVLHFRNVYRSEKYFGLKLYRILKHVQYIVSNTFLPKENAYGIFKQVRFLCCAI